MKAVQIIDAELFDRVAEQARAAPRKRMNHNFHAGPEENPHRFLNVLLKGTYIRRIVTQCAESGSFPHLGGNG